MAFLSELIDKFYVDVGAIRKRKIHRLVVSTDARQINNGDVRTLLVWRKNMKIESALVVDGVQFNGFMMVVTVTVFNLFTFDQRRVQRLSAR